MTELCLMWASKCHYCWQLLLKTTGVRALFPESSDFGGVSGLPKGSQPFLDVTDECCLGTDDIHMDQGLLPGISHIPGCTSVQSSSLLPQVFLVKKLFQTFDSNSAVWKTHNLTSRILKINSRSEHATYCYFIICVPPWFVTAKTSREEIPLPSKDRLLLHKTPLNSWIPLQSEEKHEEMSQRSSSSGSSGPAPSTL